jgi:twinkle protein
VDTAEQTHTEVKKVAGLLPMGEFKGLPKRGLTEETCKKFKYFVSKDASGQPLQVATYFDEEGTEVAQKIRAAGKQFRTAGDFRKATLFGQNLWSSGKKIVITDGEIDCLSVSQVQGNRWPVVSIPSGAQGAVAACKKAYEFLLGFEEIILMFDMDEPGRKAARDVAEVFPPGRCKIASLPAKDPNELLMAGKGQEIITAIWNAKEYRPDGILAGHELWETVIKEDTTAGAPYPWEALNTLTHGARLGELVTLTAGSGIGKSAVVREIAYHLLQRGEKVGMIMLEETPKRTALGLMGIHLNRPLHISRDGISEEDLRGAFDATVGCGSLYLYNHFGSTQVDNLLSQIRYMSASCGCRWIVLDHLSIVVSGLGDGDERRLIDNAMTQLRTLVEETGVGMFLISHLRRPEGKGHEEGAHTSLSQLRGSHSIAQLSDMVIGLERDQQGDTPDVTTMRVLKNRFTGETGEAGQLKYMRATGRLVDAQDVHHVPPPQFTEGGDF